MINVQKVLIFCLLLLSFFMAPAYSQSPNEINIIKTRQLSVFSNSSITLDVNILCIDGYKYTQIITSRGGYISTDIIQMNQEIQGVAMPAKCSTTDYDKRFYRP